MKTNDLTENLLSIMRIFYLYFERYKNIFTLARLEAKTAKKSVCYLAIYFFLAGTFFNGLWIASNIFLFYLADSCGVPVVFSALFLVLLNLLAFVIAIFSLNKAYGSLWFSQTRKHLF